MDEKDWATLGEIAKAQGTELPGGVAVAKRRKCGKCGQTGHNARTCPTSTSTTKVVKRTKKAEPEPEREPLPPADQPSRPRPKPKPDRPKPKLSAKERKLRQKEGKLLIEARRKVMYARVERWLKDNHQIIARRVTEASELKPGTQMVFVEVFPSEWGGSEPTAYYRGKVLKFDKKEDKVHFKYQRDTAKYATDTDYILNLQVPGRSRYFLLFDGKSAT